MLYDVCRCYTQVYMHILAFANIGYIGTSIYRHLSVYERNYGSYLSWTYIINDYDVNATYDTYHHYIVTY